MVMITLYGIEETVLLTLFGKREIETIQKKINGRKLKQTEKNYLSRSIRKKVITAYRLANTTLLQDLQKRTENDTYIEYNLNKYGYKTFILQKITAKKCSIEELIIDILIKFPKARYIEAIPIILLKNQFNPWKLLDLASQYGCKNKIGYLLETADILHKIKGENKKLLIYLEQNKEEGETFLIDGDKLFLEKTSPLRVRKWNLLGRFFDEDFKKLAEVYL